MNFKNLIFGLFFVLPVANHMIYSQECNTYKVINIDSTQNYFMISVEKNMKKFLIVSEKRKIRANNKIFPPQKYLFKLVDHNWQEKFPPDIPRTIVIEGKTICRSEDDFKVYLTSNLKGLKYVKRCGCPR